MTAHPEDPDPMVSVRGLSLEYARPDGTLFRAVEGLDLDVLPGEFICIVGPSGCGKSTLLSLIDGLIKPTDGDVYVKGKAVNSPGPDRAMVFQSASLLPWRTVLDNVRFGLDMAGVKKEDSLDRCMRLIELVGLKGFEHQVPRTLSGGMQQRVNLARALAIDAEVLLMDEPFASLDAQTREVMQAELLDVWSTQMKTVLFVTHQTSEAVYLADRVVVLSQGPGRVRKIIDVDIDRPRSLDIKRDPRFNAYDAEIWDLLHNA